MARISNCLMLAAGAVILLPAIAQADIVRSRHAAYRHYHYATYAYPYRSVGVILTLEGVGEVEARPPRRRRHVPRACNVWRP